MKNFSYFRGRVILIEDYVIDEGSQFVGCYKLISVVNRHGFILNFMVSPRTYFVDRVMISVGDRVTGFFDANAPFPLVFRPQYKAIVIVKDTPYQNVKVDYFNSQLLSRDGRLQLIISPYTQILLENDQAFNKVPVNRDLIVVYGATTKSIPAQTTPYKIIVMCDGD